MSANIKTIDCSWVEHWDAQLTANVATIRIVSPFINSYMARKLVEERGNRTVEVITRYNLNDFPRFK